jgi:dTDP-4-dehydrorhamnose reductase
MKILLLGSKGQLGRCLSDQLSDTDYDVIYTSRSEIDMADLAQTKIKITDLRPNIVINASAYTEVDKAEDDKQAADKINHLAVANIASICSDIGCWLIHISTDYVFDGAASYPYDENAKTNPQGVYGDSKLKGELAIQSSGCKYLIVRTAWVYSEYGNNFLKTMLRLGDDRDELSIVGDQIGCPTYAQDIAKAIVSILSCLDSKSASSGIYHYCGDEPCSIKSIATVEYPTPAVRPAYSVLDCTKIEGMFDVTRSNWRDGIKVVIDKLQGKH